MRQYAFTPLTTATALPTLPHSAGRRNPKSARVPLIPWRPGAADSRRALGPTEASMLRLLGPVARASSRAGGRSLRGACDQPVGPCASRGRWTWRCIFSRLACGPGVAFLWARGGPGVAFFGVGDGPGVAFSDGHFASSKRKSLACKCFCNPNRRGAVATKICFKPSKSKGGLCSYSRETRREEKEGVE